MEPSTATQSQRVIYGRQPLPRRLERVQRNFRYCRPPVPRFPAAQCNTAATEIENGEYDSAIARLQRIVTPQAWNNLAIAHWHKGEYPQAQAYFTQAAQAGDMQAIENLQQYERWWKEKD